MNQDRGRSRDFNREYCIKSQWFWQAIFTVICGNRHVAKLQTQYAGKLGSNDKTGEATMRILLAEDDSVLADGLTRSLRQSGYAIDCVKNGQDADTALSTQEFDLLILDLGLPRLSGLDVLRRLRARGSLNFSRQ